MAGHFIVINKYMVADLQKIGLWNSELKNKILLEDGNIGNIAEIPQELRELYKTAWEVKQRAFIDQAKDRGAFVCQSQSMNLFVADPTTNKMNSMHFYAWESGLKTGMYYLRTKPRAAAQKFSIAATNEHREADQEESHIVCESCSA